jgi:hypothetical protein
MATFKFLGDFETSPLSDFWRLDQHDIPTSPGVYFLIARPGVRFLYPNSTSSIFYIGQASSLRRRLLDHLKYSKQVRDNRRVKIPRYWPRYEYAGAHGGRYCFIKTKQGRTPKALEDIVLTLFAKRYRAFPVGNGSGAWNDVA